MNWKAASLGVVLPIAVILAGLALRTRVREDIIGIVLALVWPGWWVNSAIADRNPDLDSLLIAGPLLIANGLLYEVGASVFKWARSVGRRAVVTVVAAVLLYGIACLACYHGHDSSSLIEATFKREPWPSP